ncbi:MAG: thermonuclease family protein [Candidatus Shapirobacteria bacterium]|nr:thermonuclease family protein [Candidatus Shapirobacteria bacterium]MDD4410116.1 thermonuclease family protein [Candidatus Shapirobacteria bacterium]
MKKKINLKNLGWMVAGVLFLMLAFKNEKESNKEEIKTENITPTIMVTPTETIKSDLFLVTKIIDGDTLMVKINDKEESVRLIGIDTPETVDPRKTVQCFGKEASLKAKELMENKIVRLDADITQMDRDKYGRLLRYVYLEDGTLINKKLIEEGFGFEYTYQVPYKFQAEFKTAQKIAEEKKMGMWADGTCPTPTIKTVPIISGVPTEKTIQSSSSFICDCSKACTKISSCEEAYYQLNTCGCSVRDNDGDGVPCESLCN